MLMKSIRREQGRSRGAGERAWQGAGRAVVLNLYFEASVAVSEKGDTRIGDERFCL
jgi:hypothetical protein